MSIQLKTACAAMILTAAIACGTGSSPTAPAPTSVDATIVSGGFTPNSINISIGSTVMWTNKDAAAHSIVADTGAFSSGTIAPDGQYSYMFRSAGTFAYHDGSNANMAGTVNVSGASSPSPY
jgi:plastocyanin